MSTKKIKSALISVFDKGGLETIIPQLKKLDIKVYSTGGTYSHLVKAGLTPFKVEDLTSYPSILDGRVKTLHPKVFGGILARRESDHLDQLSHYEIPEIDLVVVDLYPFEQTVAETEEEDKIIEKVDIGGIALIRAAAKNFGDVLIIPSKNEYGFLEQVLVEKEGETNLGERKLMAATAFNVSSHYDTAIFNYFAKKSTWSQPVFKESYKQSQSLRYGENPHQAAEYFGDLQENFTKLSGKALSFNNLVDVDAAVNLMSEYEFADPTFAILKHTNSCGVATRSTVLEAWHAALEADNISAFGGILITNTELDLDTAKEIDKLFYEVLIAKDFTPEAQEFLTKKAKRVLLRLHTYPKPERTYKSLLNGVIVQDSNMKSTQLEELKVVTKKQPSEKEISDLLFANKIVKHLKSNTIVLVKNDQLLGMGCGQTSRVDACEQAIKKAQKFGFDLAGAVMASDAFFPFPDCVALANEVGIKAVIQPGGSIKDQLSIDYCDENSLSMVFTGTRHFKH